MRKPKFGTLARSLDALLAEKRSLAEKERSLIVRLNKVLAQIGYRVERAKQSQAAASPHRRLESHGHHITLKSVNHQTTSHGQKRRGRPPLRKIA
jgi:hypothetical protein